MTRSLRQILIAIGATLLVVSPAAAQGIVELGVDAGATFGLGNQSSAKFRFPASRARAGYFLEGGQWSIEPGVGLGVDKIEGSDAVFTYDLELGALYHFRPFAIVSEGDVIASVSAAYVRPFVGFSGFTGGATQDSEFSIGAGFGFKVPLRTQLAWRVEGNLGYGFDNEALRIGALVGVSFFMH